MDTNRWDSDGDGVSNPSESIAGTPPLVDEAALLEVREMPDIFQFITIREVSEYYELSIPKALVINIGKSVLPIAMESYRRNILRAPWE